MTNWEEQLTLSVTYRLDMSAVSQFWPLTRRRLSWWQRWLVWPRFWSVVSLVFAIAAMASFALDVGGRGGGGWMLVIIVGLLFGAFVLWRWRVRRQTVARVMAGYGPLTMTLRPDYLEGTSPDVRTRVSYGQIEEIQRRTEFLIAPLKDSPRGYVIPRSDFGTQTAGEKFADQWERRLANAPPPSRPEAMTPPWPLDPPREPPLAVKSYHVTRAELARAALRPGRPIRRPDEPFRPAGSSSAGRVWAWARWLPFGISMGVLLYVAMPKRLSLDAIGAFLVSSNVIYAVMIVGFVLFVVRRMWAVRIIRWAEASDRYERLEIYADRIRILRSICEQDLLWGEGVNEVSHDSGGVLIANRVRSNFFFVPKSAFSHKIEAYEFAKLCAELLHRAVAETRQESMNDDNAYVVTGDDQNPYRSPGLSQNRTTGSGHQAASFVDNDIPQAAIPIHDDLVDFSRSGKNP